MIEKDSGLILKQIKYNDKSNIVTIFTRNYGKKSFILYGINSRTRGKVLRSIVQPLYPVNIIFYHKQNRNLAKIKDVSLSTSYTDIPVNFNKKAIMIFLSEVLDNVLLENMEDKDLFDYTIKSLQVFDLSQKNYGNFHIMYLLGLMRHLGIEPKNNLSEQNRYFSLKEGIFTNIYDATLTLDSLQSQILSQLLKMSITEFDSVKIPRTERNLLLKNLLNYFHFHIDKFKDVKSLEVLEELFE